MMNIINVIDKSKADKLVALGFKCNEQRLNANQVVYSFFATQELLQVVNSEFANNDFYINKTVKF